MVRHLVLWRLRATDPQQKQHDAVLIRDCLEPLLGQIPGLLALQVGINQRSDEQASDVVLCCDFSDWAALETYHQHPAHQAVLPVIGALRQERRVIDFEC